MQLRHRDPPAAKPAETRGGLRGDSLIGARGAKKSYRDALVCSRWPNNSLFIIVQNRKINEAFDRKLSSSQGENLPVATALYVC